MGALTFVRRHARHLLVGAVALLLALEVADWYNNNKNDNKYNNRHTNDGSSRDGHTHLNPQSQQQQQQQQQQSWRPASSQQPALSPPLPQVFVALYSGGSNDSSAVSKADALAGRAVHQLRGSNRDTILDSWADGNTFFVTREAVNTPNVIRLAPEIEHGGYNGLIAKTEAAWADIYKQHVKNYDYFLKGDDDTYVNIPRARYVLSLFDPNVPTWLGRTTKLGFCHGGGAYVLSRALLTVIGPHFGKCPPVPDPNTQWEDRFMQLCLMDKLDLGQMGLWATCTSDDSLGFDSVLANRKDQAFNAEVLYNLFVRNPDRMRSQASYHSVHATLANYMFRMYRVLADTAPATGPPLSLSQFVTIARNNWEAFGAFDVRDRTNFVTTYRCEPGGGRLIPNAKPSSSSSSSPALCQDWQLRARPTMSEALGKAAHACDTETPAWRVVQSSTTYAPVGTGWSPTNGGRSTPAAAADTGDAGVIIVPVYRILTKEVVAALTLLIESLRRHGGKADVIVVINEKLDLYDRAPGLTSRHPGVAVVFHDRKWNGLTPGCDNLYGFCLYTNMLEHLLDYGIVMKASVDTYFQADPFATVRLRNGLALFLTPPFSVDKRWDAFGPWTFNVTSGLHFDAAAHPERCTGTGPSRGCSVERVGLLCQLFFGTSTALRALLLHTVATFEVGGFHANLRRCIHTVARQGRVLLTAPTTIYPADTGPVFCLTERCLAQKSVLDRALAFGSSSSSSSAAAAAAAAALSDEEEEEEAVLNGGGGISSSSSSSSSSSQLTPPIVRNALGHRVSIVHGWSTVFGIRSQDGMLVPRAKPNALAGLVPDRPAAPAVPVPVPVPVAGGV